MAKLQLDITLNPSLDTNKFNAIIEKIKSSLGIVGSNIKAIDGDELADDLRGVETAAKGAAKGVDDIGDKARRAEKETGGLSSAFKGLGNIIGGLAIGAAVVGGFQQAIEKGTEFRAGLAELEAITGVSGSALDNLSDKAKGLAAEFGGSASGNIEAFKGILSKLGPDIAATPAALESMTRSVNILSAATGDDAVASMDALTTGILQFQVPLEDAVVAADEMSKMMNTMAAGAKFGAAEVPEVAEAIKVAGVAASGAKVSFEETNASIQALAAGGKVGAEAGTALRNVMSTLEKGRFLPKEVQAELAKAGVDINVLSDKSLSFSDRLRELQKVEKDAALMANFFGTENAAAGAILLRSVDSIDKMTVQLTGTNTATEQAAVNQKTFAAQMAITKAAVENNLINTFTKIEPVLTSVLSVVSGIVGTSFQVIGDVVGFVVSTIGDAAPFLILAAGAMAAYAIATNATAIILGAAAAAQGVLNAVMAINPAVAIIAGIIALVGAYKLLTDALVETSAEKLENAKASDQLIQKQRGETAEQLKGAKSAATLTDEYKKLAEKKKLTAGEAERMKQMNAQLNEKYPDLIKNTTNYKENLSGLDKVAAQQTAEIKKLQTGLDALDRSARESAKNIAQLTSNVARGDLAKSVRDNLTKDFTGLSKFFGISSSEAAAANEKLTKDIAKLYQIKDETTFKTEALAVKRAFIQSLKLTNAESKEALDIERSFSAFIEAQANVIKVNSPVIVAAIQQDSKANTEAQAQAAAEDKKAKEERLKAMKEKATQTAAEMKAIRDLENLLKEQEIAQMEDSLEKRLALFDLETKKKKESEQEKIEAIKISDLGKVRNDLNANEKKIVEGHENAISNIIQIAAKNRQEVEKKFNDDQLKKNGDARKKELDEEIKALQNKESAITGASVKAAEDRLAVQLDILKKEREAALIGLEEGSNSHLNKITEFAQKEAELRKKLRASEIQTDLGEDVTLSAEERAHRARMIQLEEQFNERLLAVRGNYNDELSVFLDYQSQKQAAEEGFARETNTLVEATFQLRDALNGAFTDKADASRREEVDREKAALRDQEKELRESRKRGSITYDEYLDKQKDIAAKRNELEQGGFNLFDSLRKAASAGLDASARKFSVTAKKSQENYETLLQSGMATEQDINDARMKMIEDVALSAGTNLLSLAAQGKLTLAAFGESVIDAAFQVVAKQLQIAIVGALFTEASSKGMLGLLTGAAVGVVLQGAFAGLKSIIGRATGEVGIKGPGTRTSDDIPRLLSVDESVITAQGTLAPGNADAFRWVNKTGGSLKDYYKGSNDNSIFINQQGQLSKADNSAINTLIAVTREEGAANRAELNDLKKKFYHRTETALDPVELRQKGSDMVAVVKQAKRKKLGRG